MRHDSMAFTTSIAMATYNGARYVREQLESFARQTQLPDELVICDDGSTDESVAICKNFAATAPFPVSIHCNARNSGYTRNFEKALSLCTKDIVFLSDQDDVWYPEKIATVIQKFIDEPQASLIVHDLEYCDADLKRTGQTKIARIAAVYDPLKNYVTGMATATRRTFLDLCLPFPQRLEDFSTHDGWLHSCAGATETKAVLSRVLADYRRHEINATAGEALNDITIGSPSAFRRNSRRRRFLPSQIDQVERYLQSRQALLSWLKRNRHVLEVPSTTLGDLETTIERTARRVSALSMPRRKRLPLLIKMYRSGVYAEFSGIRSLFKDALIN